jgi:hypothetical protein
MSTNNRELPIGEHAYFPEMSSTRLSTFASVGVQLISDETSQSNLEVYTDHVRAAQGRDIAWDETTHSVSFIWEVLT